MAQLLSKIIWLMVFFLCTNSVFSQEELQSVADRKATESDYNNKDEFKKYKKRARLVSSWQIQNLKFGAIVVRLQNNARKINAYQKAGDMANLKLTLAETQYRNRLIIKAFSENISFCKVYFIYGQSSDSLLNGKRTHIFIDTNLTVNPQITMNESFYLLVEEDFVYQSSIGFVKEEDAKTKTERGTSNGYFGIVFKNKYGHQLKEPFPYKYNMFFSNSTTKIDVFEKIELTPGNAETIAFQVKKTLSYKYYQMYASDVNHSLNSYYRRNQNQQITDVNMKPFLY